MIKNMYNKNKEIINYIIIGILTTGVNLVSYIFMYKILELNLNISNIISILIAILFAYFTNKIFVFKSECKKIRVLFIEFTKFVSSRVLTMIIEVFGVYFFVAINGNGELVGKVKIQIITLVMNYILSKFVVFKK